MNPDFTPDFLFAFALLDNLEDFDTLSDAAGDPGGLTFGGVSERYHKAWFDELMAAARGEERTSILKRFYWQVFWKPLGCDAIGNKHLAYELFETAVNSPAMANEIETKVLAILKCTSLQEVVHRHPLLPFLAVVAWNEYQHEEYRARRKKKPQFYASWVRRCHDNTLKMLAATIREIVNI